MPSASHTEVFSCSVPELYKIITDYEKYPEFLSEVKSCKVIKQDGNKKMVEYHVSVIKSFKYTMSMNETEPNSVTWEFVSGEIFKTSSGSWKLVEEAGKTKATYSVEATFSLFLPGPIAKTLLSVNLPNMMSAYHKRIKQIYGK